MTQSRPVTGRQCKGLDTYLTIAGQSAMVPVMILTPALVIPNSGKREDMKIRRAPSRKVEFVGY